MKWIWLAMACLLVAAAPAPVEISVPSHKAGPAIPDDFIGLSFGMKSLLPDREGNHFFSETNTPLITLFQNLGIRHLRLGGTTVESPPSTPIPGYAEIDDLFAFARAAGVKKVIYSLRLMETNATHHYAAAARLAKYIWEHDRAELDCFAIGNEPDLRRVYRQDPTITNFDTYLAQWRRFADAIVAAVPEAKFCDPDAGSGNVPWTLRFAAAEKDSHRISALCEHFYVGGAGKKFTAEEAIDAMLSPDWDSANQRLYDKVAKPVLADGLAFRFTEANDHYNGGTKGASETFSGALWALDFLHWWAEHDTAGVDFHNTQWVVNDTITRDANHQLAVYPKGYGLRAFDVGGHGRVESVAIVNPQSVNLTVYSVRAGDSHFFTIINKEHGEGARSALATIRPGGGTMTGAAAMFLSAPDGNAAATNGITLGGDSITNDRAWHGRWSEIARQKEACTVTVPAAGAVIVRAEINP